LIEEKDHIRMSRRKSSMVMPPLPALMISGAFEIEFGGAGQVTPLNAAMRKSSVDITRSATVDISAELSRTRTLLEAVMKSGVKGQRRPHPSGCGS